MIQVRLDKIEERDVDFIVMQALTTPWFAEIFLSYTEWDDAKIVRIEHSLTDPELGESDITVIAEKNGCRYGMLIESKIDAAAMPEQYVRYCRRGERGKERGDYLDFMVFLIAPQAYIDSNEEAQKYKYAVSYESLHKAFMVHEDIFSAAVLQRALEKQEEGYTVQEVPSITLFWRELYAYACASSHEVDMYPGAGAKGSRSTWPQFRVPLRGTALYYKAKPGVVDLQFSGKKSESLRLKKELRERLESDMHWEDTGNSISLRIKVKPMDFTKAFSGYRDGGEVDLMLQAVERLRDFAVELNDAGYTV